MYCKIEHMYMYRKCVTKKVFEEKKNFFKLCQKHSNDLRKQNEKQCGKTHKLRGRFPTHLLWQSNLIQKQKLKPCSI